ncbi:MAG: hypothetical protein Q8O19_03745 [Rectinemataceae bacterium]|nr:hypothetical protein [Rectinemataceae bacterium]
MSKARSHRLTKDQVRELRERLMAGTESYCALARYFKVTEKAIRNHRDKFKFKKEMEQAKNLEPVVLERALQVSAVNSRIIGMIDTQDEWIRKLLKEKEVKAADLMIRKAKVINEALEVFIKARNSVSLFPTIGGEEYPLTPAEADAIVSKMTPEERTKFIEDRKRYERK